MVWYEAIFIIIIWIKSAICAARFILQDTFHMLTSCDCARWPHVQSCSFEEPTPVPSSRNGVHYSRDNRHSTKYAYNKQTGGFYILRTTQQQLWAESRETLLGLDLKLEQVLSSGLCGSFLSPLAASSYGNISSVFLLCRKYLYTVLHRERTIVMTMFRHVLL